VGLDTSANGPSRQAEAILFCQEHLKELAAARDQGGQSLDLLIGERANGRANGFGKLRQHLGIHSVRLGQLPRGSGEVPHLPRVDSYHRETKGGQCAEERHLQAPSRFEHNQCRLGRLKLFPDLEQARGIMRYRKRRSRTHSHIELCLRNINADKYGFGPHLRPPFRPAL
jgi:hypothetical protein